ncbi:hypothetical protein DWB58_28215, partial [candidate division KSB1 bacterium]|nr:hypothetical protein [candidate division KSB1 bacterium]
RQAANQSFCEATKNYSVKLGVFGDKAFPPKCTEVNEHRRKNLWQDDLSAELFQIVLPTNYPAISFQNFILTLKS